MMADTKARELMDRIEAGEAVKQQRKVIVIPAYENQEKEEKEEKVFAIDTLDRNVDLSDISAEEDLKMDENYKNGQIIKEGFRSNG